MISTDRSIFDERSNVRARFVEYMKEWEYLDIIVFAKKNLNLSKEISVGANCTVYSTDSLSKFFYTLDAIDLGKKLIEKNALNQITCQDSSLTAMVGVSLKNKFKIPLEIQVHGDIGSPYFPMGILNKIRLKLAKKYLPQADKIRVVSNKIKDYVEKILIEKVSVLNTKKPIIEVRPIFVDKDAIRNALVTIDLHQKYKQFDKIVLMASRLEKEKDIGLAINAWSKVSQAFPGAGLLIVGSGSQMENLKNLVTSKSLDKSVVFENWVDKQTLYSYYKTADLFLNTSMFEGYGMTLVEAEASGCKIVSTDVGIAREVGAHIVGYDSDDTTKKIIEIFSRTPKFE
jgi:glycosyltransferase involved in cell wall biosynthesis